MSMVAGRGLQPITAPNNLPHHLTSFVGRDADLRALRRMLAGSRLITITGTGGAGKTRLVAELTRTNLDEWPDGVWWVELASSADVAGAVLAALQLPGRGHPLAVVTSWLAGKRALLVLDNCEHLTAASAGFCKSALESCGQLSIVTTSREPLGVAGEARWPLSPLAEADALRLFEVRAGLVAPSFQIARANHQAVSGICDRLDRLPLAIEMAAARLDVMSERELLANLTDRFRLLTSGDRTAPERQQTLAAAIDWSHRLLSEDERRLFRWLAVFQAGFTLEAVEAVCAQPETVSVLELLTSLVQKSLVMADRLDDGSTRYRLLESHAAYALDRLRESGELDQTQERHYEYFMVGLQSRTIAWTGPQAGAPPPGIPEQKWKARESANLWAALEWAKEHREDSGLGLALEVADFEFSDHTRTRTLLLDLLARSVATGALRARALNIAARLVTRQGDYDSGRTLADQSVSWARKLRDPEIKAYIVNGSGMVYHARGDLAVAARMYDEALSLLAGSGNRRLTIEIKNSLGVLAVSQGDNRKALELLAECVAYSRAEGDEPSMARHLESLANAQLGVGHDDEAVVSWTEALAVYRDLNDPFGTIWCLGGLALAASARGDHERALRLAAVAGRMSREWSLSTGSPRLDRLEETCAKARAKLGSRRGDAIWNDGQVMGTVPALTYALGEDHSAPTATVVAGPLSRREREVAAMVAAGMTNRQIAARLFIAERTAEGHVERIRNKLELHSRSAVAAWAIQQGIGPAALDNSNPRSSV